MFPDGPDAVVWNPHQHPRRWSRARVRIACTPGTVLCGLSGVGLLLAGPYAPPAIGSRRILVGVLLLAVAATLAAVRARCWATDHAHHRGRRCALERTPGEFFHRTREIPAPAREQVAHLLHLLRRLHTTATGARLDPALHVEAHHLVWAAVTRLAHTTPHYPSTGHPSAEQPSAGHPTEPDGQPGEADELIDLAERALSGVLAQLHGCTRLTHAATRRCAELRTRLHTTATPRPTCEQPHLRITGSAHPNRIPELCDPTLPGESR